MNLLEFRNKTIEELKKFHDKELKLTWCGENYNVKDLLEDFEFHTDKSYEVLGNILETNQYLFYNEMLEYLKIILKEKYGLDKSFEEIRYEMDKKYREIKKVDFVYGGNY